jgi:hypothetical protein
VLASFCASWSLEELRGGLTVVAERATVSRGKKRVGEEKRNSFFGGCCQR